ncbi:MAG: hypothetical protein AAF264_04030 [Pseudomonadota bacterium]
MATAPQPNAAPARKVLAGTIGAAIGDTINKAIDAIPSVDAIIGHPSMETAVVALAVFLAGYFAEEWSR